MFILGINTSHDASAALYDDYRLIATVSLERLTRKKKDGKRYPHEAVNEVLSIGGVSHKEIGAIALGRHKFPAQWLCLPDQELSKEQGRSKLIELMMRHNLKATDLFNRQRFLRDEGFDENTQLFFYNHHFAHALGALFHTDWDDALVYTSDGQGDFVCYSHTLLKSGRLNRLYGSEWDTRTSFDRRRRLNLTSGSMGYFYRCFGKSIGFNARHAGKVMGLAAFGKPVAAGRLRRLYRVDSNGVITRRFLSKAKLREFARRMAARYRREDVAASVQKVLEDLVVESVGRLVKRHKVRRLAVAGGIFANVLLNQKLVERLALDEIFVYPAMSDEGLAAGGVLQYLLARDGLDVWLKKRHRLTDVYFGRNHDADIESVMKAKGASRLSCPNNDHVQETVQQIIADKVVAIYRGRMEYGPRALGARSILAAATDRNINNELNKRLSRTEFMPFAPVVRKERAHDVFALSPAMDYAARFMTITCAVREEWREKIPAVVHVDGTARPQVIEREANPLYYDILAAYEAATGLPVLINTSFNAHEEPIINTPAECTEALVAGRVDAVVTEKGLWTYQETHQSEEKFSLGKKWQKIWRASIGAEPQL